MVKARSFLDLHLRLQPRRQKNKITKKPPPAQKPYVSGPNELHSLKTLIEVNFFNFVFFLDSFLSLRLRLSYVPYEPKMIILDASSKDADTPSKVGSRTTGVPSPQNTDAFGSAADSTTTTPPAQAKEAIVIPQPTTENMFEVIQLVPLVGEHPVPPPDTKEPNLQPAADKHTPSPNVGSHQTNSPTKVGIFLEDDILTAPLINRRF